MEHELLRPTPWMIIPFGVLLAMIALGPLWFSGWWTKHYPKVAFALGAVTLGYYLVGFVGEERSLAHHALLGTAHEYISFIALVGSLFVVAGGIHINVKGISTPRVNVLFLLVGAIIANVLGTTGASMLLIRPWIRMNKTRITAFHIVFFILIVSNVGGCLTPVGDPPLFLGYIEGIPFWWVAQHCWPMWLTAVGCLLTIFYALDRANFGRAPREAGRRATADEIWRFDGLPNLFFLAVILGSVFIKNPPFLREGIMLAAAIGSYLTTKKDVHRSNDFNFHPIKEVAVLFVGIFATMLPALQWLEANATKFDQPKPSVYYWASGSLSSVLDNAPTYLSFLSAATGSVDRDVVHQVQADLEGNAGRRGIATEAMAREVANTVSAVKSMYPSAVANQSVTPRQIKIAYLLGNPSWNALIVAISIGAVFFGANTYIGNGPNFMVKAIAEQQKVNVPHFMEYIYKFALPFMLPVLIFIWLIFFR